MYVRGAIQAQSIIELVADAHDIQVSDIIGRKRLPYLVQARMEIARRMRVMGYSEEETAYFLHRKRRVITYYRLKKYTL